MVTSILRLQQNQYGHVIICEYLSLLRQQAANEAWVYSSALTYSYRCRPLINICRPLHSCTRCHSLPPQLQQLSLHLSLSRPATVTSVKASTPCSEPNPVLILLSFTDLICTTLLQIQLCTQLPFPSYLAVCICTFWRINPLKKAGWIFFFGIPYGETWE